MITKARLNALEYRLTGACIEVHRNLGPGLLESVYHKCLARELQSLNIKFIAEKLITLAYKDFILESNLRADFLVEDCIVVELKAVENIIPIHEAQLLTYMKLLRVPKGLLINFNCTHIATKGKKAFVNEFYRALKE